MTAKKFLLNCIVILVVATASSAQTYWPTNSWRTSTPEQQGIDSEKLIEAFDHIRQRELNIHSLLIVRNGYVVLDAYFYPYTQRDVHDVASVTKSITSTLIGVAIDKGKIKSVNEPVLSFFPNHVVSHNNELKQRLLLKHLLTMTSGLRCEPRNNELTLLQMRQANDWAKFMMDLPMAEEPGSKFVYCSGGMHLLSGIISRVTGENGSNFARRTLFGPLGIRNAVWPSDPQGVSYGWGDLHLHPRDMAKIGYLWLQRGMWNAVPVLSADWVKDATLGHTKSGGDEYGYGIWIHPGAGVYEALGRGGQRISVVPSRDIVVVFTGGGFEPGDVGKFLLAAVKADNPLPENPPAVAHLKQAVNRAAIPPSPKPVQPLPPLASTISGRVFEFGENVLGLKELSLNFKSSAEASVRLAFADKRFTNKLISIRPLGLDSVPRISPQGRFGLPIGLKGLWKDAETFVLDYDEIANINHYQLELKFVERDVLVKLSEKTGTANFSFSGTLKNTRRAHSRPNQRFMRETK